MKRVYGVALLVLALLGLALVLPVQADGPATGNWRLTVLNPSGTTEATNWIVKLETQGGKTTATLVAANPTYQKAELVNFAVDAGTVRGTFRFAIGKGPAREMQFEGRVSDKDAKKIAGTFGTETAGDAAYMVPTELKALDAKDINKKLGIDPLDKAVSLNSAGLTFQLRAQQTKDAAEKDKLLKQAAEAAKTAAAETPKLYHEVLQLHPGTFSAGRAAMLLLQGKSAGTPADLKIWAETASKSAAEFGPKYQLTITNQITTALLTRKQPALAAEYAQAAEKLLTDKSAIDTQVSVLQALSTALTAAGKTDALKPVAERLAKLNKALDEEYLAKVPPFRPDVYAGRKGPSQRVTVMELFTGAECPPCVAADVAFDALQKTYKSSELVLIQYHMHIPGPDPMTNADTEARWKYYRDTYFPKDVRGTPTTLFNGFPKAGGGGGMANAENKYKEYRGIIDPLLETPSPVKVRASAKRVGDKVQIAADVAGVENPGDNLKLRLILVEKDIRYVGGNKLRFHHQVVRALPGGAEGVAIVNATLSTKNEVDVAAVRKQLVSYLDDYAANTRPFLRADRPLDMSHLRVIALVQNDATREILQAVQVEVIE